ncbi:MAG: aminotransferase class I/II-fold pyridoxal phosphate-dependent enzyme [Flavobacteriales bacterium]|jgi:aspartate/methionine/tyrosine aminotransferase|uniref:pyridoxal phosphate-dependent aminotransferase n=1 Tax=Blattabacterium sp. (Mastotermes darwiniensis) TaxID=39768 RepID=UPI000231DF75|nr:aminotransferase class I/II-fold pyridoxal phosphate-dependent enzyme [Blattabacterium sp. (Mastotermes darwiniensis)]AER40397.1 aspartate/tyrosine/aromatic aminotransferase [Blattabacterium sp. (Mastotermes darwiniensis) str. MADAR]MDR1804882.1 aminotransferase class I/II-fold pyridoxal phosphate-dependent enzyme [Flavobacteriales bacterium]
MILVAKRIHKISEYFFSEKMRYIQNLENKGIEVINLGIGNPDLLPPNGVIHKMKKASEIKEANTYQSSIGIESLRKAISDWYGKTYKVNVDHEKEVLPLMGSKEGIMYISLSYLDKGNQVLIPNPGYPIYSSISKLLGSEIIYYDLHDREDWSPNIKFLEKKNLSNVKIMWINYPHMPTGATLTFEKLEEIVFFAKRNRILLVHDTPYSFLLNNQRPLSVFNVKGAKEFSLELNSLSKSYNMAGWRVGMIIGKKEFIKNIIKVKSLMDSGMYYPIQMGAIEAMNQNSEWFKKLNIEYFKRKRIIWEICDRLYLEYRRKSSGIFVWARITDFDKNDREWSDKILKDYHIFITPGSIFGDNGKGYVRLSMCCPVKVLEKAKNRIFS